MNPLEPGDATALLPEPLPPLPRSESGRVGLTSVRFALGLARREARASFRGLLPLLFAITTGVAAVVALQSFTDGLLDSVRAQAQVLLGADLVLSSNAPFPEPARPALEELARVAGVGAGDRAEVISFAALCYLPRSTGSRLVQVLGIEGPYPLYGRFETAPLGEWPRLADGAHALVDPALLTLLDARVGDTIALGESRFVIRGALTNVPGDIGVRASLGPRVYVARRLLAATGLLAVGSRARHEVFLRLPAAANVATLAERFRPALARQRVTLRTVAENQRSLGDTLLRMGRYLGLVALLALLLGGLGVASAVHVFVQRRLDTVAILRCLGASTRTLFGAYLAQAAGMGLAGSLLGCGLGSLAQLLLPRVFADFLPVEAVFTVSPLALAQGVMLGVWVAVVFALGPLLPVRDVSPLRLLRRAYEGTPVPVRRGARLAVFAAQAGTVVALSLWQAPTPGIGLGFAAGVGSALGVLWLAAATLVRAVRRFFPARWPYLWRQGLANLYRPANQTVVVVLALGFGTFLLATLVLVQHNLLGDLRIGGSAKANLALFDIQPDQRAAVEVRLRDAGAGVTASVPIVPMRILSLKGKNAADLLSEAASGPQSGRGPWALRREYRSTYRDETVDSERLVAGQGWVKGAWRDPGAVGPLPISVEQSVASELGVGVGDEIVWDVQGLALPTRVANLREVHWARFEPNFFVVFPDGPLRDAPQTFATLGRLEDPRARAHLQRQLAEAFPNVTLVDLSQVQHTVDDILDRVALAIRFMALFSLATGSVVLAGAVAATRYGRLREGALLKALGATRRQVLLILLAEYLFLGTLAVLTALGLSLGAGWALVHLVFESAFGVPLLPLGGLAAGVVALTMTVGAASSAFVLGRPPLEVLRSE